MIWYPLFSLISVSTTVIMFTVFALLCWLITRKAHWHTVNAIGIGCGLVVLRFLLPFEIPGAKIIHIGLKASKPFYWLQDTQFGQHTIMEWLVIFSLLGAVISLLLLGVRLRRQAKLIRSADAAEAQHLLPLYERCAESLGIGTKGSLILTDRFCSPMMVGLLKPHMVLPKAMLQEEETTLRYAILHELTHYKMHDLWYKLILELICCLLWWNPAAYLLRSCVSQLMELRCDSEVCKDFSREETVEYADFLLNVVKQSKPQKLFVIAGHFGYASEKRIVQRFVQLLKPLKKKSRTASVIIIAVALVSFLFTYSCTIQLKNIPENFDVMVNQETDYILRYPDGTLELYRDHHLYAELYASVLSEEPYCNLTVYDVNISDD